MYILTKVASQTAKFEHADHFTSLRFPYPLSIGPRFFWTTPKKLRLPRQQGVVKSLSISFGLTTPDTDHMQKKWTSCPWTAFHRESPHDHLLESCFSNGLIQGILSNNWWNIVWGNPTENQYTSSLEVMRGGDGGGWNPVVFLTWKSHLTGSTRQHAPITFLAAPGEWPVRKMSLRNETLT